MGTIKKRSEGEIVAQPDKQGITRTGGGIRIEAKKQPIHYRSDTQWGHVYMVLDCSGSMAGDKLEQAKLGILDFAKDAIRKQYLVGLVSFDSTARNLCDPTGDLTSLQQHFREMRASGTTNMTEAIRMAHMHLKGKIDPRAIVIATDGQPDDAGSTLRAGKLTKEDGIDIITIGTDDADLDFLKKLASRADLGKKVTRELLAEGIASTSKLLPSPKGPPKG